MCKDYINCQNAEVLELERVISLPDNAMLKVKPELWCQWDFEKNNELGYNIWEMTKATNKNVYWVCDVDKSHKWNSYVYNRIGGNQGCPYCSGQRPTAKYNLLTEYPEICEDWNYHLNKKNPNEYNPATNQKVWWKCKDCDSDYFMSISSRTSKGSRCHFCSGRKANHTNNLTVTHPHLVKEWHPTKNDELTPNDITYGSKSAVWWLGECGHEWEDRPYHRSKGKGCPYCTNNNRRVLKGFNDLWTTRADVASMLLNPEDGYKYTKSSTKKLDWKCPNCNTIIKDKNIYNISKQGLSCTLCSDGNSYPEKLISNVLSGLNIDYYSQKVFGWLKNKRYDFYIPSLNVIIEAHGVQHSETSFKNLGARTLQEEQENDKYKYEMAIKNGIDEYIIIDCKISEFDYIKNSIINSKLNDLLDLNTLDWEEINRSSTKSLIVEVCKSYTEESKSPTFLANKYGTSRQTIIKYLKKGNGIGLVVYDAKPKRPVAQLTEDGEFIIFHNSIREASRKIGVDGRRISEVLSGRSKSSGGYKWMYKEDYEKYIMKNK